MEAALQSIWQPDELIMDRTPRPSCKPRLPFLRCEFNSVEIPPSDERHHQHFRWLNEKEEDRLYWEEQGNTRQGRVIKDGDSLSDVPKPPRMLVLEPRWAVCVQTHQVIKPSDDRHIDHELWRVWQADKALDTAADRTRRAAEERFRNKQLGLPTDTRALRGPQPLPEFMDLLVTNCGNEHDLLLNTPQKRLEQLQVQAYREEFAHWSIRWLRNVLRCSARRELETVKKYTGWPML